MSGSNKTAKKSLKTKQRANDWRRNVIVLVVFGGGLILFAYLSTQVGSKESKANDSYLASLPAQQDTIAHNKICMVDDIYQGNYPTILLTLSNRAYYGCSAKVTQDLATKPNIRKAHQVTFPVKLRNANNEWHADATMTFDRSKYDIKFGSQFFYENLGDKLVYDDVDISINLTLTR